MRHLNRHTAVLLVLWLGLLGSCGGGGGGGAGGGIGGGLPAPAGTVTGRLNFLRAGTPLVAEQEPNNDFGSAQLIGDVRPGQSVTIVGALDAGVSGDVFDAFRIRFPTRTTVTATIRFGPANDFDLALYDPVGMQFVKLIEAPTSPAVETLYLNGTVDFVITANSGVGSYELELVAAVSQGVLEQEPNDTPAAAQYVGEVASSDAVTITGQAHAASDPVDTVLVACPEAITLDLSLLFPSFQNFDVRVLDGTTDLAAPTLLSAFNAAGAPPELGQLVVSAGTLLVIEVRAALGSGLWHLTLSGTPPPAPVVGPGALKAAAGRGLASLELEARCLGPSRASGPYGVVDDDVAEGEVLVGFHPAARAQGEAHLARCGAVVGAELPGIACKVDLSLPAGLSPQERRRLTVSRACAAGCASCVRYSEPNRIRHVSAVPDDTYYNLQWHYDLMNLEAAWDITTGSSDTIVAVIDTGRFLHVDLDSRFISGYDTVSHPSLTGDGDGPDPDPTDLGVQTSYHGTHVAGTIGAETNNNQGVAGVTWATRLMPIRALGNYGAGTDFDIATAILYAAKQPNSTGVVPAERADIINMSLGGPNFNQTLSDACDLAKSAGVTIVAAAGNASSSQPQYPASYASVISVSAVDAQRRLAPYSSFGSQIDVAAPGGNTSVDTNADGYPDGVLSTVNGGYTFFNGTSMASPHVAGLCALLIGLNPTLTPDQVKAILIATAADLGAPGRDDLFGHGLVDAFAAVASIAPPPGGPPPPPSLLVTPETLNFGPGTTQLDVSVFNLGGGTLDVTGVDVLLDAGETWLQASLMGSGDATRNIDGLRVTVDPIGLPTGSYFARLQIHSNAGDREVGVAMTRSVSLPPPPDLDIHVFAVSIATGAVVEELVVNPTVSLDFIFAGLVAGEYFFVAATDVDGDGVFEEPGEYQGAFPIQTDPLPVLVIPNITTAGVRFDVELGRVLGGTARLNALSSAGDGRR